MTDQIPEPMPEQDDENDTDKKLNTWFSGRVVRKDLTTKLKGSNNVPVYVLEYLLGSNCATDDNSLIEEGIIKVPSKRARQMYKSAAAVIMIAVAHKESTPSRTCSATTR